MHNTNQSRTTKVKTNRKALHITSNFIHAGWLSQLLKGQTQRDGSRVQAKKKKNNNKETRNNNNIIIEMHVD